MASTSTVTPRALTLSGLLKQAIDGSGLSVRGVAKKMDVSHPTILRWTDPDDSRVPDPETVATLLVHLGIDGDKRENILAIARKTKEPDWLSTGASGISQQLAGVMELERTAIGILDWAPLVLPGMVQTAAYARTIISADPDLDEREVDALVAVRLGRQNALTREQPVEFSAFIGVPALHGGIGGAAVMVEQLRHLRRVADYPTVDLRIVPVDQGWHGGLSGAFLLYERPGLDPVLHCEHYATGTFVTATESVHQYHELVDTLRGHAWNPDTSRALIEEQIEKWETTA